MNNRAPIVWSDTPSHGEGRGFKSLGAIRKTSSSDEVFLFCLTWGEKVDKIYTRRGDEGWTELLGGRAVAKTHPQVEAYGTVDELTANLGLAATMSPPKLADQLMWIQERLFVIGAILAREDLSAQERSRLSVKTVEQLERWIDELQKDLPRQTRFLMPGPERRLRTSAPTWLVPSAGGLSGELYS